MYSCHPVYAVTQPKVFECDVTRVMDGDTVKCKTGEELITIRLAKIDAPEKKQEFGPESKANLESLVQGKHVKVASSTKDLYGRVVGEIFTEYYKESVNYIQVKTGNAWFYSKYSKDTEFEQAQERARADRKGLWGGSNPIQPAEFRAKKRQY